jgi:hypothetical protein
MLRYWDTAAGELRRRHGHRLAGLERVKQMPRPAEDTKATLSLVNGGRIRTLDAGALTRQSR